MESAGTASHSEVTPPSRSFITATGSGTAWRWRMSQPCFAGASAYGTEGASPAV